MLDITMNRICIIMPTYQHCDDFLKPALESIFKYTKFRTNEYEIDKQNKLMDKISKMDICPLCKSKITEEHIESIHKEMIQKIESLKKEIESSDKELSETYNKKNILNQEIERINLEVSKRESDLLKISNIHDKQLQIKSLQEKLDVVKGEISEFEKREKNLQSNFDENSNIDQKCETLRMEVQEVSFRNNENLDSEISFKNSLFFS